MSWASWEATWRQHATTRTFGARVEQAIRVAQSAMCHGKLFCSLSGGKDSVALAGILKEAGLSERVPCAYAHTALNFPDTMGVVEATVDVLGMDLEIVEPDELEGHIERIAKRYGTLVPQPPVNGYTEWDLLRAIPAHVDIAHAMADLHRAIASGNMLVAYTYAGDYDGSFVGLRADESRARAAYSQFRGPIYRHESDGKWQVCPLLPWSGNDVYAFLVSRKLPIHPFYRKAYEAFQGGTPPERLRVDLAITHDSIARHGSLALVARVYPALWKTITEIRPELRQYR